MFEFRKPVRLPTTQLCRINGLRCLQELGGLSAQIPKASEAIPFTRFLDPADVDGVPGYAHVACVEAYKTLPQCETCNGFGCGPGREGALYRHTMTCKICAGSGLSPFQLITLFEKELPLGVTPVVAALVSNARFTVPTVLRRMISNLPSDQQYRTKPWLTLLARAAKTDEAFRKELDTCPDDLSRQVELWLQWGQTQKLIPQKESK